MPNQTAPFDAAVVRAKLATTRFADVRYIAHTESTNIDAQALLGRSGTLGTTIVAEYQSAGMGRKGRRWFAPPGSALLFTAILPEAVAATTLWAIPFWVAVAVAGAIEESSGVSLDLVWPNDMYAHGAKIGGILSVARISGEEAWVGCGVGLNVVRPRSDAGLDAVQPQPGFLTDLSERAQREAILVAILAHFDRTLAELRDPAAIARRWERHARLAGTVYRYRNDVDGIERDGTALRIGAHGALIVTDSDGRERAIDMADVRVTGRAR